MGDLVVVVDGCGIIGREKLQLKERKEYGIYGKEIRGYYSNTSI